MAEAQAVTTPTRPSFKSSWSAVYNDSAVTAKNLSGYNYGPNIGEIPKDYQKRLDMCRFYYKRDPIVATVINKMIDVGITKLHNRRGKCTDKELAFFNALLPSLQKVFKQFMLEYLLSGMIIPEYEWASKTARDLSEDLTDSVRQYTVPTNFWVRDPSSIILKPSALPDRVEIFYKPDDTTVYFIQNKGKYMDGTTDIPRYLEILKNFPEFVASVQQGNTTGNLTFRITNQVRPIFRKVLSNEIYPTLFLEPALMPLQHKSNLIKMDYALAARVISAIQLITLGNDMFPLTQEDEPELEDLKKQMHWRSTPENYERIFQLFGNHTLQVKWVIPDVQALLDDRKYGPVNQDIFYALGFPQILTTGETSKSQTSNAELAMFSPAASLNSIRAEFEDWCLELYKEVRDKNGAIKHIPTPEFDTLKLYDIMKAATIANLDLEAGVMSRSTRALVTGLDFDEEAKLKIMEKNKYPELLDVPDPDEEQTTAPKTNTKRKQLDREMDRDMGGA